MEVDLTNEGYRRWLRARQPQPIAWFLSLDEESQEAMGMLGDDYTRDVCIGIGVAVVGELPQQPDETDEDIVRRLTATAIGALGHPAKAHAPSEPIPAPTLAGIVGRRLASQEAHAESERRRKAEGRSFLGKAPAQAGSGP